MYNLLRPLQKIVFPLILTVSVNSKAQKTMLDTTFLLKEYYGGIYHSIFIEPNRNSKYYASISDYGFGEFDRQTYNESLDYLKKNKLTLTKVSINELPKKWISLYQYKGNFYVYHPSDFYSHYKIKITEKSYIDFNGEGPSANKILDFKKIDENTFRFNLNGISSNGRVVVINLIDKKKGIAVFEETSNDRKKIQYLMIDADKIRDFPLVVNYCEHQKQPEFEFDTPNFKQLLRQKH